MASMTATNSRITPICPHKTADIVEIVRTVVRTLDEAVVKVDGNQTNLALAIDAIRDGLSNLHTGIKLLTLQMAESSDETFPISRSYLHAVPHSDTFDTVAHARKVLLNRSFRDATQPIIDQRTILATVVVTNQDSASGQLSHPDRLKEVIDEIEHVCSSIDPNDHTRFLEALETACHSAHRAGARIAALAIRDAVDDKGRRTDFESFYADSEDRYHAEASQRRGRQNCVYIPVSQHDIPE